MSEEITYGAGGVPYIGTKAPEIVDLDFTPEMDVPSSLDHAIIIAKKKNPK